jgi:predicted PurR-regulated permease PerM
MTDEMHRLRWPRWLPWLIAACAVLALYRLSHDILIEIGQVVKPVLVPLLLALAFAYLLEPLVEWLQRRFKLRHELAVIVAIGGGIIILVVSILFLIPPVVEQLIDSAQKLPQALITAGERLEPYLVRLREHYPAAYETVRQQALAFFHSLPGEESIVARAIGRVGRQVIGVTANILNLILIPVFTFYILRDLDLLRRGIERLVPAKYRPRASRLFDRTGPVVSNYVRGQLTVAVILSLLYTVGFWIARVPLALSLGVLAGFGYLIPYIGTLVAVILTVLLVLLANPGWWPVISVLIVYVIVQTLEGFLITPRILGDRLKLHPMVVIIGLIIGGSLFGILGIILALPVMALLKVLLEVVLEPGAASQE